MRKKMNLNPDDFIFDESVEDMQEIPTIEEEKTFSGEIKSPSKEHTQNEFNSLVDELFSGEILKKPEKVSRTYYLDRDVVKVIENLAEEKNRSSSIIVNTLLKKILL